MSDDSPLSEFRENLIGYNHLNIRSDKSEDPLEILENMAQPSQCHKGSVELQTFHRVDERVLYGSDDISADDINQSPIKAQSGDNCRVEDGASDCEEESAADASSDASAVACRFCYVELGFEDDNWSLCKCTSGLCLECFQRELRLTESRNDNIMQCTVCKTVYDIQILTSQAAARRNQRRRRRRQRRQSETEQLQINDAIEADVQNAHRLSNDSQTALTQGPYEGEANNGPQTPRCVQLLAGICSYMCNATADCIFDCAESCCLRLCALKSVCCDVAFETLCCWDMSFQGSRIPRRKESFVVFGLVFCVALWLLATGYSVSEPDIKRFNQLTMRSVAMVIYFLLVFMDTCVSFCLLWFVNVINIYQLTLPAFMAAIHCCRIFGVMYYSLAVRRFYKFDTKENNRHLKLISTMTLCFTSFVALCASLWRYVVSTRRMARRLRLRHAYFSINGRGRFRLNELTAVRAPRSRQLENLAVRIAIQQTLSEEQQRRDAEQRQQSA